MTPTIDGGADAPEPPVPAVGVRHSVETATSAPSSPADELRRAAGTLRKRAHAATPGPWVETGKAARYGGLVAVEQPADDDEFDGYGGQLVGETLRQGNREYLAIMHPDVGMALAELLDEFANAAQHLDDYDGFDPFITIDGYGHALTVARLINGGAA